MRFLLAWCGHDNHDPANRSRHMAVAVLVPANACDAVGGGIFPVPAPDKRSSDRAAKTRRGSGVRSSGATALTAILKEPPADRTGGECCARPRERSID